MKFKAKHEHRYDPFTIEFESYSDIKALQNILNFVLEKTGPGTGGFMRANDRILRLEVIKIFEGINSYTHNNLSVRE